VAVADDGTFACRANPSGEPPELRIEVEHDGNRKVVVRRFHVEK
jgi:hypothetical protein